MSRRISPIAVSGVVGCLVLLICLCVAATGVVYLNGITPALFAAGPVDRIAYVDNNLNIQLVDAQGGHRLALTNDASDTQQNFYIFPTWSPDSRRLAFIGIRGTSDQHASALYTTPATGGPWTEVFTSTVQIPFYLYWSPDSQRIGFLAQTDTEMSLMLGQASEKNSAHKLETGSPFFWDWSPDSNSLLLHIGGSVRDAQEARMALLNWRNTGSPQTLRQSPGDFQAPDYAPNGASMLFAGTTNSSQDALFVADAQGGNTRSILSFDGRIAFAWSPDGKKIATMVTPSDAQLPYLSPVFVSDADGANRKQITKEDVLSFYWSPDSRQIAYLTVVLPGNTTSQLNGTSLLDVATLVSDASAHSHGWALRNGVSRHARARGLAAPLAQTTDVKFNWRVVNVTDGSIRTVATFQPTQEFVSLLPNFDQYARSITFWSPDSQHLVYTQTENDGNGAVWVADVSGKAQPQKVGDGTLAVWSWK